ncbi:MAG: prephenate dehydrogenase [Clostridia bacterium]|nr:prephenate dehydrogenase [Clostridia bacterium]
MTESLDRNIEILLIGVGLIGGSYAKGLKKAGFVNVSAIVRRRETADYLLRKGLVKDVSLTPDENLIKRARLAVLGMYPDGMLEWLGQYGRLFAPGTIVTDVSGVKGPVVRRAQALMPQGVEFISAHPMAGREVSGAENSDETIFRGANYIVVPTENNSEYGIAVCRALGNVLGFERITELSPEKHDEMIGYLSQLTHCIAICLMTCRETDHLIDYTGDSFRDLTRIARINDLMWSELFMLNRKELLGQIDLFLAELADFRKNLADGDVGKMREKMRLSTERRGKFDKSRTKKED